MIYCENIVKILCTWQLFFLLIHRFHNFFFTFSAISLPQLICHKFFELIIINHVWFIVKILCTWQLFFFYSFTDFIIFFSIFGNGIATIAKTIFFFPFSAMVLPQLLFFNWTGSILGRGISVTVLPKFLCFLSPPFSFSLSYFCWISATLLPKFFLSPQFTN